MSSAVDLRRSLLRLDGRGYKNYQSLKGIYDFSDFTVFIDHIQGDPFAPPSRIRIRVPQKKAGFPKNLYDSPSREVGLRDYLARQVEIAIKKYSQGRRGIGKSGLIYIPSPGQEILERSSIIINQEFVEARLAIGFPAYGRRIAARQAEAIFFEELPRLVENSLFWSRLNTREVFNHVNTNEDADYLRSRLDELGLVAFVADGALLPRASGVDPRPLSRGKVVLFRRHLCG